ncbi:MAG TPA: Hpt domain-containing protein [Gallionellaceae bacterium]|nr:Hpt domain-containing protein [Gallionellaceae bacterium]
MVDSKHFNPLPLLSVKEGLDSSLALVGSELEDYFKAGWEGKNHLQLAHDELHRTVGVLQMLSLEGLAVFSRELETVLHEMLLQQQTPTALHRDTLRGAMLALTQYLDALADGASNTALRLFYSYQELHQLRGLESAFEVDLFFPEFGVALPDEVLDVPLLASAAASIKKARAHYQRALLKWLRQDNPDQSLRTMRDAVQTVMACAPQDQHRAFWWIATGLLDCLIHDGLPAELNANKLLARIDLQMKSMVENTQRESEHNTTCSMQYMLARSHSVSDTVDKIKQTYVLDTYLPEEQPLSRVETERVLEQMHDQLNQAEEMLEHYVQGDADGSRCLAEKLDQLYKLSEQLDRDTLQFLSKQMYSAVADTENADAVHRIRMEMAMAMLLLGNGIERYQRLGSQFHEQERLISQNLQSGISGDAANMANLSALHCRMEEQEILLPLANEMKGNLQQVELSLTVFFSDAGKHSELTPLRRLLAQVHGGFYILSLDVATNLVSPVQQAVERYINGETPAPEEMLAIASAVSALENYVHGLSQGQKPDTKDLEEVLRSIEKTPNQADQTSVIREVVVPTGVAVREGGEDAELMEVFLEEAQEVLETLHEQLEICQRSPHGREELITIRRGFHTLKGSGRMVGLTNLGEVAWAVEKALNKWLQGDKPTSISVLELIGDAEVLFQHWVDKLRSGGSALIDATALIAAAQRIENGAEEVQQPVVEAAPEIEATPEIETELSDIVIGGVTLSPILFKIATDEASSIIDTLQRLVVALCQTERHVVSYDFVRAAHTLAGVSRSTGFTDISDLASALESWLQEMMDSTAELDVLQISLLEQSINALAEMVSALRSKVEPKAREDLINRLQIKKNQLNVYTDDSEQAGLSLHEINQKDQVEQKEELPAAGRNAIEASNVLPVAQHIKQERANDPPHDQSDSDQSLQQKEAHQSAEIKPEDEDMDLVAYVQRLVQEHASEPLQWQSAEEPSKFTAGNDRPEPAVQANEAVQIESGGNIFSSFDLGDLQAGIDKQPAAGQPDGTLPAPEAFSINFDDLALSSAPQADALANAERAMQHTTFPELDLATGKHEAELLSSLQLSEQAWEDAAPLLLGKDDANTVGLPSQHKSQAASRPEEELADSSLDNKKRKIQDDLDEQLLPIFLEEADELYPQLTGELSAWRENPDDTGAGLKIARKLQRSLHTLKGSARMAGAMRLGELTHRVEDCLDAAVAEGKQDAALLDELENYFDRIGNALEKLRSGDTAEDSAEPAVVVVSANKSVMPGQALAQSEDPGEGTEDRRESAVLRVRSDIVDDLVNEAGEISVARSRMEIELNAFKGGLLDLTGSVQGLRKLVREIEMHAEGQMQARAAVAGESAEKFDPLEFDRFTRFQELTRFMSESVHDVQTVQQTLLKNLDETSAAMSAQAKLNSGLQQSLMSIRMLPFSSISQRLYRIVRQTGKELDKKVNLELYGTEIELDRGVLEKMTAPFEHLLRNAIVHGLENPEQREAKGKPPIGNIAMTLRQEGNEVVFEFKDDGAGLDTAKLRQKGVEQGLLQANEVISDEKAMMLIFESGLSTASELTEISGRGVGMDVVLSEIKALGGRIEVSSEADKGACFTIYLPLTLAVMKALMVRAGNDTYAIPSVMVEQVQQIKADALQELYRKGQADWQGKSYPLHYLPRLLGDYQRTPDSKTYNAILLLRSGDQRMALHLDELSGNREVVVKNVGVQLARLPGIAGATVQANGKVVLILNPVPLAQQAIQAHSLGDDVPAEPVRRIPLVMIVDDSLTVRKITTRLLTRVGYEVVTAKDGVDAIEKLEDLLPDAMLLDVEMPRMDGFELTKHLRRDARTKNLPIIMITSRTAEKHRNYALELGVNEYLGKPYQDDALLENLARFAPLLDTATTL